MDINIYIHGVLSIIYGSTKQSKPTDGEKQATTKVHCILLLVFFFAKSSSIRPSSSLLATHDYSWVKAAAKACIAMAHAKMPPVASCPTDP
jgi:hypothetical protein